jgi:glucose-6-phosphate isomerase
MGLKLIDTYTRGFISGADFDAIAPEIESARAKISDRSGAGSDFLGWVDLPENYRKNSDAAEDLALIKRAAEKIRSTCDIFVVIGIGGSYLGARAAIEFVRSQQYNLLPHDGPQIFFAGNGLSTFDTANLLRICSDESKNICVNVISKSGKTTEPAVAFRLFRELLERRYGEEGARERIYVTTDRARGKLLSLAREKGYQTFVVPDDIGGRYSVLTPVGLLPIAVAGLDIDAMLDGAASARRDALLPGSDAEKYAALRNLLLRSGKPVEIFASYESRVAMVAEWWKQLYGESEGKDGRGLFPASVTFSTDLHSLGQYIQQGTRNIFETVLYIKNSAPELPVPADPGDVDGLGFLEGKPLEFISRNAFLATLLAHTEGGVPNIVLNLDAADEFNLGYLFYFFEYACALSGYILGVNPFDQPGVEAYKNNMYALLGMPGAENEALRAKLVKRLESADLL